MPRLAANLSMLFTDRPFAERFQAAAAAGFEAVEFLFPYEFEPVEVAGWLEGSRTRLVLHNLPAGNWATGERGIACLPDRRAEFREGVHHAIAYATALNVPQLNCLAGIVPDGLPVEEAEAVLVENLQFAAGALARRNLRLLIEPLNTHDVPGFCLSRTSQALKVLERVGARNLQIQYDVYHMQRMEGELGATLSRCLPHIGHVQIADNPGRGEPGTGEINYHWLFRHLDAIGYDGWVGCEYKPRAVGPRATEAGLGWRVAHGV